MVASLYSFPEKNVFRAREALDTDFDIDEIDPTLYVDNLDDFRIVSEETDYKENLYFLLNIDDASKELLVTPADYLKILFLGHRGCGKTTELRRIHRYLDDPKRYFAILIETEQEMEIGKLRPEDFFIVLVLKIVRKLKEKRLNKAADCFDDLLKEWLNEKEIEEEFTKTHNLEGSASLKADTDGNILMKMLSFIKFEAEVKGTLARESKMTEIIRTKIKRDLVSFIIKFNDALDQVREHVAKAKMGRDILFIIDGTEKASYEFYEDVFQKNGHVLRDLNANLITTLRLDAFYRLEDKPNLDFYQKVLVPMIPINEGALGALETLITKRVDKELFFEDDAIKFLASKSGGSLRQMLRLCSLCIYYGRGKKVDMERAEKTVKSEGEALYHALTLDQKKLLTDGLWVDNWSDADVQKMLFAMALLKYNGKADLNPLIKPFFN